MQNSDKLHSFIQLAILNHNLTLQQSLLLVLGIQLFSNLLRMSRWNLCPTGWPAWQDSGFLNGV